MHWNVNNSNKEFYSSLDVSEGRECTFYLIEILVLEHDGAEKCGKKKPGGENECKMVDSSNMTHITTLSSASSLLTWRSLWIRCEVRLFADTKVCVSILRALLVSSERIYTIRASTLQPLPWSYRHIQYPVSFRNTLRRAVEKGRCMSLQDRFSCLAFSEPNKCESEQSQQVEAEKERARHKSGCQCILVCRQKVSTPHLGTKMSARYFIRTFVRSHIRQFISNRQTILEIISNEKSKQFKVQSHAWPAIRLRDVVQGKTVGVLVAGAPNVATNVLSATEQRIEKFQLRFLEWITVEKEFLLI